MNAAQHAKGMAAMFLLVFVMIASSAEFRKIRGQVEYVGPDNGWIPFGGKVIQVLGPGCYLANERYSDTMVVFTNAPHGKVDGDTIKAAPCRYVGNHNYTTVLGAGKTVRILDYGVQVDPPLEVQNAWTAKIRSQIEKEQERKQKADATALAYQLKQASNGVRTAQYDIGMRYLRGNGVPKDTNAAVVWLQKAAAQDSIEAKVVLNNLGRYAK
jgi:hypothetical protein